MRKALLLIASLWLSALAAAQTGVVQNHSFLGGKKVITSGTNSTNYADGIIPGASITVYLHNTTTKATIYTVTGGTLANPFFSNAATAVDPGGYVFRANLNVGLDVVSSGGGGDAACTIQPNCYLHPVTLLVDVFPNSSISPIVNPLTIQTNEVGNTSQALLDFKDTASVLFTNPSGGIESATVPDGSNSSKGILKCDGTTTDCTGGTIVANPGLEVQTNEVNNTSQTLLDFQNSSTVTFRNVSGGIETADVNSSGGLTMQIVPPIAGQYVFVPATVATVIDAGSPVATTSPTSVSLYLPTGSAFEVDATVQFSNFVLPSYIVAGNVTAVYGVVVSSQTNYHNYNSLSVPGQGMLPVITCGAAGQTTIAPSGATDGWTLQQSQNTTDITGTNIGTATCTTHIAANYSGGGNMIVPKIGLLVYYTGTAPPLDNRIIIEPPLTFNPDNNHLAVFIPPTVGMDDGLVNVMHSVIAGVNFHPGLIVSVLPNHANTTTTPTLAFNSLTSRTIVGPTGAALAAGDYVTTVPAVLLWSGTNWMLQNPQVSGGGGGGGSVGTTGQFQMVGATAGSFAPAACTDNGTTITCTEPIDVPGPPFGFSVDAGTAVAGATGTVVYASDPTVGYAEVNENNTGLSRICTVANGLCTSGGGTAWDALTAPSGNLALNLGTHLSTFTGGLGMLSGSYEQQNTWTVGSVNVPSIYQGFRTAYGFPTIQASIANEFSLNVPNTATVNEIDAVGSYVTCNSASTAACVAFSGTAVRGVANSQVFGANFNAWDNNLSGNHLFALEVDAVAQNSGTSGELIRMDPWINSRSNPFYGVHLISAGNSSVGLTSLIESDDSSTVNFADIGQSSTVGGTSQRINWGNGSTSYAQFVDAGGLLNFNGGLKIGTSGQFSVASATGRVTITGCGAGTFVAADGSACSTPAGSGTVTVVSSGNLTSTNLVTGGGSQTLQTPSSAATLDSSGNMTATQLLATGIVDGKAPITITTGTSATLGGTYKSGYTFNQEATAATGVAYTLPTAAAGLQYCIGNSYNGSAADTGVLTLNTSASGQFIIFTDGTLSATGGNVTSGGAGGDAACVVGVDTTHWQLYVNRGTWTKH